MEKKNIPCIFYLKEKRVVIFGIRLPYGSHEIFMLTKPTRYLQLTNDLTSILVHSIDSWFRDQAGTETGRVGEKLTDSSISLATIYGAFLPKVTEV